MSTTNKKNGKKSSKRTNQLNLSKKSTKQSKNKAKTQTKTKHKDNQKNNVNKNTNKKTTQNNNKKSKKKEKNNSNHTNFESKTIDESDRILGNKIAQNRQNRSQIWHTKIQPHWPRYSAPLYASMSQNFCYSHRPSKYKEKEKKVNSTYVNIVIFIVTWYLRIKYILHREMKTKTKKQNRKTKRRPKKRSN